MLSKFLSVESKMVATQTSSDFRDSPRVRINGSFLCNKCLIMLKRWWQSLRPSQSALELAYEGGSEATVPDHGRFLFIKTKHAISI